MLIKADTLHPPLQAQLIQPHGKNRETQGRNTDNSTNMTDLVNAVDRPSVGVQMGNGEDNLCEVLDALNLEPGQRASEKCHATCD